MITNPGIRERFLEKKQDLEAIIREHIPGDFSNWEQEDSRWQRPVKAHNGSKFNPTASSSAWATAAHLEFSEQVVGHIDERRDSKALADLELAIEEDNEAIGSLSFSVVHEFDVSASDAPELPCGAGSRTARCRAK